MKKMMLVAALMAFGALSYTAEKEPYTHKGYTTKELMVVGENNAKEVKWVTVDDIRESLKNTGPIVVSFDIDDTVLASSPCFFYGEKHFSKEGVKYTRNQEYWNFLDESKCDEYSLPKNSSKEIIKMHLDRGDQVIFITGRTAAKGYTGDKLDSTAMILQKEFGITNMKPISYRTPETKAANKYDKTYYIKKYGVSLHYGDSDDDILAARESGIRGIRVERALNSNNTSGALNGGYGEEVVKNSSY
ncbi:acid phosphatase AphA [Pseudostreptobacillus hongkongensis]|uniref:acid phosphatase AphA n=1 Tax=Pseudostreptobacillus hongkongensis TaxID=1162717 RepID=UPI00082E774F|nr:acid phosphatase AphA [Pseudostreptobacillus hongkongensis]